MAIDLKRRHMAVLEALFQAKGPVPQTRLPGGNGVASSATGATMSDLRSEELVEYLNDTPKRITGYLLSDLGREVLTRL